MAGGKGCNGWITSLWAKRLRAICVLSPPFPFQPLLCKNRKNRRSWIIMIIMEPKQTLNLVKERRAGMCK